MSKVLVSVCNTGWIHKFVSRVVMQMLVDRRHQIFYIDPTWRPYEHNLNRVVKDLIDVHANCEWWLNIDSDNPPLVNPLDLVEWIQNTGRSDIDIVGLPTPVWADIKPGDQPYYYNTLEEVDGGWRPVVGEGLKEVDAVGSGCMLVHRRVIETLHKPIFVREYDQDGFVNKGPDFRFCQNAKRVGFKVWSHYDFPCTHMVENDLGNQIKAFSQMKPNEHSCPHTESGHFSRVERLKQQGYLPPWGGVV